MKPYQHNSGPGVIIGIPTLGRPVPIEWAMALKSMNPPTNYNTVFHLIKGSAVDMARNEFTKLAIEKEAKYLFMVGDDVVIPNHTLRELIFRMEQDPTIGVVGGIYCTKVTPSEPLTYRGNGRGVYWDWKVGEFFEVSGIGMDCTLIRTDLLKELKSDWFSTVNKDQHYDAINAAESWTEDLFFCHRVLTETKYKIYADAGVLCQHWDVEKGIYYSLPITSLPYRRATVTETLKQCLLIRSDQDVRVDDVNFEVTSFGCEGSDYRGQPEFLPFSDAQFEWVVVSNPGLSLEIGEYKRVCKPGGKITMKYSWLYDKALIAEKLKGTISGEFIEVQV